MIFTFQVKSRLFKKPPKNVWFQARIEIDAANKKLLFSTPRDSNELYEEYETGECKDEQMQVIEPNSLHLAEFRAPKIISSGKEVTKQGEKIYKLEMPGRGRVGSKGIKMAGTDLSMFQEFYTLLAPLYNIGASSSASMLNLAQLGRHHSNDSKLQPTQSSSAADQLLECGGVYATVVGDGGELPGDDCPADMIVVTSSIYEAFEQDRCIQVTFVKLESHTDTPNRMQLASGDPVYLYVGFDRLELLSRDRCPLCDWPYTQIRSFGHSERQIQLDVGTRTCTGRALMTFSFETSERAATASASFVETLARQLATSLAASAPACGCCHHALTSAEVGPTADDEALRSNPCYANWQQQQGRQQQPTHTPAGGKSLRRQPRLQSAEPDYYSSVVKPPTGPGCGGGQSAEPDYYSSVVKPPTGPKPPAPMPVGRPTSFVVRSDSLEQPMPPPPPPPPHLPPRGVDECSPSAETVIADGASTDDEFLLRVLSKYEAQRL